MSLTFGSVRGRAPTGSHQSRGPGRKGECVRSGRQVREVCVTQVVYAICFSPRDHEEPAAHTGDFPLPAAPSPPGSLIQTATSLPHPACYPLSAQPSPGAPAPREAGPCARALASRSRLHTLHPSAPGHRQAPTQRLCVALAAPGALNRPLGASSPFSGPCLGERQRPAWLSS